jgi:hypothetical protein
MSPRGVVLEVDRPKLLFFFSSRSGRSRRVEGFVAQVLQRNRNHETFSLRLIDSELRGDLIERFRITALPTLLVADGGRIKARIETPGGVREIQAGLRPWLRLQRES